MIIFNELLQTRGGNRRLHDRLFYEFAGFRVREYVFMKREKEIRRRHAEA